MGDLLNPPRQRSAPLPQGRPAPPEAPRPATSRPTSRSGPAPGSGPGLARRPHSGTRRDAYFARIPRRRFWCTALGAGTLYGYLLHGFPAEGSRFGNWYEADRVHIVPGAVTFIAAAAVTVLCIPPLRRLFRCATEPGMRETCRRGAEAPARGKSR